MRFLNAEHPYLLQRERWLKTTSPFHLPFVFRHSRGLGYSYVNYNI
jgi:hypothetical protein